MYIICLSSDSSRATYEFNEFKAVHAGIRIFDPMLFEDTVVSKIMEDSNTKCYVMNNEEKLFQ